jgi:TonB family protein
MVSLQHAGVVTWFGWISVASACLIALALLVALRVVRRGAARFWTAPSAAALCVLPAAIGAAFACVLQRQVLAVSALFGEVMPAAQAAGSAEALSPLVMGLGATLALSVFALLTTGIGSARSTGPDAAGFAPWALLVSALASIALMAAAASVLLWAVTRVNSTAAASASSAANWLTIALVLACVLTVFALAVAIAGAVMAPRGPSGTGFKLGALATLASCALLAAGGVWATAWKSSDLVRTSGTGLGADDLPEPASMRGPEVVESGVPPPPPPPPPSRTATAREAPSGPRVEPARREAYREAERSNRIITHGNAVRVGGGIREPRKLKNVAPDYPEIAKQARVQGVVILEATIGPRGNVTSVTVLRGIPLLDDAAITAVKQWVYEPTLLNGVPVPVIMTVTVNYKLTAP